MSYSDENTKVAIFDSLCIDVMCIDFLGVLFVFVFVCAPVA